MIDQSSSQPSLPVGSGRRRLVTLFEAVSDKAREAPNSVAILTPGSPALTYQALFELVEHTVTALRHQGVLHQSRVAVVLPTGPEAAATIVAVAAGAVCVPLNPQLADEDWHRYFEELHVSVLLTALGTNSAAEAAARSLGLPIVELTSMPGSAAGAFRLGEPADPEETRDGLPQLESDAFVLPTSGTTSWPKAVPLTHLNICHSAGNVVEVLRLSSHDRLLSVLPLFHAHGLISGLLSTLAAGASVVCTRQFAAAEFFGELREFRPTWYTAVPAVHDAIITEGSRDGQALGHHSLRLIRSASASLPENRLIELECLFGVPVIETYGMTEAASQIASNPLPPGRRKSGSVGVAAGPKIAILDEGNQTLASGEPGEIGLYGPNVTRGYNGQSTASAAALENGWFRTGDLGYLDDEGYLFILGRTKDMINRGGEKIAPRKIEEVLLSHPDVAEAVAFAQPHPRLGEDVAVVVVLHRDGHATPRELRSFTLDSKRLRHSEIPRQVVVVDEIPRSETGKVQRQKIASSLRCLDSAAIPTSRDIGHLAPPIDVETRLAKIWAEVFSLERVEAGDDFFALGGESLLAIQIAMRVTDAFGVTVTLRTFFEAPTLSELAMRIAESAAAEEEAFQLESAGSDSRTDAAVSIAQESILDLQNGLEGFPIFNLPFPFRLVGELDSSALERSLKILISRHRILRRVFRQLHGRWTTVPSDAINTRITVENWSIVPDGRRIDFAKTLAADGVWIKFDLTRAPAFQVRILRFADDEHVLLLTLHHVIMDAWTMKVLIEELFVLYAAVLRGERRALPEPEFQYTDFARWQRRWCEGPEASRQFDYWRDKLHDAVSVFGVEHGTAPSHPGFATARVPIHLSSQLMDRLMGLARQEKSTVFIVLLTALKAVLLSRYGQGDICIATPMANRSRPRTENVLGPFENSTVVRTLLNGDMSFRDTLRRVGASVLDAHDHQELPYEVLIRRLKAVDRADTTPLSEVYFSVVSQFEPSIPLQHLRVRRIENFHEQGQLVLPVSPAKLMLMLKETDSGLVGSCLYKEDQFTTDTVCEIVSAYEDLLARAASGSGQTLAGLAQSPG